MDTHRRKLVSCFVIRLLVSLERLTSVKLLVEKKVAKRFRL
jgi:hypothetical protein